MRMLADYDDSGDIQGTELRRHYRRRTALIAVGATLAGAVLAGGAAIAAIPSSNGGTITACVAKSGGAVRIIDFQAGARCRTGERKVDWQRLSNRGAWSSTKQYAAGDIVQSGGSTYIAKVANKVAA